MVSVNRYITVSAVESWNTIKKQLKSVLLKTVASNFYLKSY